MNAGRLLRETGYNTDALRVRIAPVSPDDINIWPASRLFRRLWRPGIKGVTIWRFVFVDAEVIDGNRDRLARLVIHELVHVRQYVEIGFVRFLLSYLKDYLTGRIAGKDPHQAYLDTAFEREAMEQTERSVRV